MNLKEITLSKCYQTQKTTSWENSKNERKNTHYYNNCKNMNELWKYRNDFLINFMLLFWYVEFIVSSAQLRICFQDI